MELPYFPIITTNFDAVMYIAWLEIKFTPLDQNVDKSNRFMYVQMQIINAIFY